MENVRLPIGEGWNGRLYSTNFHSREPLCPAALPDFNCSHHSDRRTSCTMDLSGILNKKHIPSGA